MSQKPARVLIVEDDARLRALLEDYLAGSGFVVTGESDGSRALERILREAPEAVVLDLMLPGAHGLDVVRRVRPTYQGALLILTASKAEVDQVLGLELGADDYVLKPVEPRVLLARLRSLLRRVSPTGPTQTEPDRCVVEPLIVDRNRREATVRGARVDLTGVEFSVLWVLARHAGEVVTRDDLYREVLGVRYDGLDRGIDIHVSRVRKKLGEHGFDPGEIKSIRGAGYLLAKR